MLNDTVRRTTGRQQDHEKLHPENFIIHNL